MFRDPDRSQPMSPQLALRVATIGAVGLAMFAILFFRLWYLEVLSGDKYVVEANNNRVREVKVEAPRGRIVDRDSRVLVDNVTGNLVKIAPDKLPRDPRVQKRMFRRLARVLRVNPRRLQRDALARLAAQPYSGALVKADAPQAVVAYLLERQTSFPGVTVEQTAFRHYPEHQLAAQIVGYIGQVNDKSLQEKLFPGARLGDRVGVTGIEYSYDRQLRGRNGATRIQVDALGNPHGTLATRQPVAGRQLRLTLDLAVQKTGQQALGGAKGAFVVMDVKTGAIRALGSSPSFDPNVFSKVLRQKDFTALNDPANGAPILNRATQGQYPTGSTFKPITAVAMLESGQITPQTVIYDSGSLTIGTQVRKNAGGAVNGPVALRRALQVSSDVFFYQMGLDDNGTFAIQKWARRLGFGHTTGIDVPAESAGLIPTEKWRDDLFKKKQTDRPWAVGDNVSLAIGQGDLLASPLQVATAYAAIANGGYVVKPHIADRVEDADGAAIQEFDVPPRRKLNIKPEYRQAILDGIHMAAESPGGTSYAIFRNFPVQIAGKTGTAQTGPGRPDQSWYAALAPFPNPRYVVVVTSEAGGFGAATAAPAACKILSTLLGVLKKDACSVAAKTGAGAPAGFNPH
jgi:penicillin-binding protein 2